MYERVEELRKLIIEYIEERRAVEENLKIAKIDLTKEPDQTSSNYRMLEAQIATLEKDLDAYITAVGDYTETNGVLVKKTIAGKYTIFYEFFSKFYPLYNPEDKELLNKENIYKTYRELKAEKDKFWYDLKSLYGDYLYEGYYENNIESSSWNLFLQAQKILRNHQTPSEDYSITYIDGSQVVGKNIDLIGVGDYIKIRGEKTWSRWKWIKWDTGHCNRPIS